MTTLSVSQRLVRGVAGVLRFQPVDSEGEPATTSATVTVGVVRSDGSEVLAPGTATVTVGTARTVTVPLAEMVATDLLTATWAVDGVDVASSTVEVVGGVYLSVSAIRQLETALTDAGAYPDTAVKAARAEVETMFEDVCRRAFVPRFRVDVLEGCGGPNLVVRRPDVRSVRWVKVTDSNGAERSLDVSQIAADDVGVLRRFGLYQWPYGRITVGYEYGFDQPPADMLRAVVVAVRARLNLFRSGVPDRAVSFQQIDGGTVTLATPGTYGWVTGIPEVDEVIKRYRFREASVA
jgi:hypothetical protein